LPSLRPLVVSLSPEALLEESLSPNDLRSNAAKQVAQGSVVP
jgi:hypothetical protein